MNDNDKQAFADFICQHDQGILQAGDESELDMAERVWAAACEYKEKEDAFQCWKLLQALIKISQYNKNDGNAPLDHSGPTSMEYWRWQESISRRIASDAIENYKEEL